MVKRIVKGEEVFSKRAEIADKGNLPVADWHEANKTLSVDKRVGIRRGRNPRCYSLAAIRTLIW
jgi:hypothetical protein